MNAKLLFMGVDILLLFNHVLLFRSFPLVVVWYERRLCHLFDFLDMCDVLRKLKGQPSQHQQWHGVRDLTRNSSQCHTR